MSTHTRIERRAAVALAAIVLAALFSPIARQTSAREVAAAERQRSPGPGSTT